MIFRQTCAADTDMPERAMIERHLLSALRHVTEAEAIIEKQRKLISH